MGSTVSQLFKTDGQTYLSDELLRGEAVVGQVGGQGIAAVHRPPLQLCRDRSEDDLVTSEVYVSTELLQSRYCRLQQDDLFTYSNQSCINTFLFISQYNIYFKVNVCCLTYKELYETTCQLYNKIFRWLLFFSEPNPSVLDCSSIQTLRSIALQFLESSCFGVDLQNYGEIQSQNKVLFLPRKIL